MGFLCTNCICFNNYYSILIFWTLLAPSKPLAFNYRLWPLQLLFFDTSSFIIHPDIYLIYSYIWPAWWDSELYCGRCEGKSARGRKLYPSPWSVGHSQGPAGGNLGSEAGLLWWRSWHRSVWVGLPLWKPADTRRHTILDHRSKTFSKTHWTHLDIALLPYCTLHTLNFSSS